jgi:hypothetical protein
MDRDYPTGPELWDQENIFDARFQTPRNGLVMRQETVFLIREISAWAEAILARCSSNWCSYSRIARNSRRY